MDGAHVCAHDVLVRLASTLAFFWTGGLEREWLRPARMSGCLLTVSGFLGRAHTWLSEERDEEKLSEEL